MLDMPRVADDWGELEYYDPEEIISRRGRITMPGGIKVVGRVSIMLSPVGLLTYNRGLAGVDKQKKMDQAFGNWVEVKRKDLEEHISEGRSIAFVEIKFGGRAFNFPRWMHRKFGEGVEVKVISLKNERVNNPNSRTSWGINCWGWDPAEYDENRIFLSMSDEEKEKHPFVSKEKYIEIKGINHLVADLMVIAEGAGASGETVEYTLREIFKALTEHSRPLPQKVYIYVNFGSTLTLFRAKNICNDYGVELDFTFMGSAIEVSSEGLLPGLKYTDLSQMNPGSITFRELIERTLEICIDFAGRPVTLRCSCGDVGESLDVEDKYYLNLILENLRLGIPLHNDTLPDGKAVLMNYWNDFTWLQALRRRVHDIQIEHSTEVRDWLGNPILTVIGWQEEKLRRQKMITRETLVLTQ